ncbi:hypothetical protein KSS87_011249 [Heliosperma pusillum]|nr:hypothetical protein KSS87_011249 [Heliosperma pusillum]
MASSYKNMSGSNNQRGRSYALMLLLAFGAAILGVMVLHKLREKRIFSLLVKQKDHELLTLHLLFQREQEFNKDARKKIEEMKTKVYSLRSQKLELDRTLLEMESTIASLRDERKVIESTLEEKKNEIKMLTEEGMNSTFPHVSVLQEMIKTKDTEIEHLKLRLSLTESNFTGVNHSVDKATKHDDESQTDGIVQQQNKQLINENEKSNDLDGNQDKEKDDLQSVSVLNVTEAKVNDTGRLHDNTWDKETRESINALRGGLKVEELDAGVNGSGLRVRRRHSRRTRLRDVRNRRYEEHQSDHVKPMEVHLARNQTEDVGREDQGYTETKPKEIEETENGHKASSISNEGTESGNGKARLSSDGELERQANNEADDKKQIDKETNSQHDTDANRKLLKMHSKTLDVNKNKDGDEKGKNIEVGKIGNDDLEDTGEAEIDKTDIQRFSESDPDEEEAEEADEQSEF